ncbi:uncharacterized protein VTP21DRAFT_3523 [Calcarisporiella thermophila]|uniref:uncharacterized protein n=1 Tax=Calcarisporiella thermophila TaxID=911321 RepID=UPI003743686E
MNFVYFRTPKVSFILRNSFPKARNFSIDRAVSSISSTLQNPTKNKKERLVILGSGWAGFKLIKGINKNLYDVTIISPRNYFVFTPLLASTSVGTLEFRSIVEPVKSHAKHAAVYEAFCEKIDMDKRELVCKSNLSDKNEEFRLSYDKLVIAVGAKSNTFNIPGVMEHGLFLKEIKDAQKIRARVIECFEMASQPGISNERQQSLLHFAVVGGGPTGVEFSAELTDFIKDDLAYLYPNLMDKVRVTVYDIAPKILSSFDSSLSDYATKKFIRRGIEIRTGAMIQEVNKDNLIIKGQGKEPYGMLVWATGLTENPLIKTLETLAKGNGQRLLTDDKLRVIDVASQKPIENIYAIGDCATIKNYDLPATAQVANQKGIYLRKALNKIAKDGNGELVQPFSYKHMGSQAYIGGWRAIVELGDGTSTAKQSGLLAWLFWRSAYFTMSVSWKNKTLIPMYWFLTWIFGRDISRF